MTGFLVAVIVLVQGAGVAEAVPNPDSSRSEPNRNFTGQVIGNVPAAVFRGMPVGGAVSQTALNSAAGARTRWSAIWSSGFTSRIALAVTFVSTLLLPVTGAEGIGVSFSLVLQLNQEAMGLKVVRLRVLARSQAPLSTLIRSTAQQRRQLPA
ncbi:SulP family inorganic anion transporter [Rhodococcus sp. NPDC057529]|uniref:SulP family inorganic anion transporter n=1 Tax=Rhodococcus sp. NPDC057529 TaxID=3346158 RepID=UPI00366E9E62